MRFPGTTLLFYLIVSCLFFGRASAQPVIKNYEKEWDHIGRLVEQGLHQSALAEVKKLFTLARNEKQDAQMIKALVIRIGLQQGEGVDPENAIPELEKEIPAVSQPARSILYSLLADLYWSAYENSRWVTLSLTKTTGAGKKDIATWDAEDYYNRISSLYLASIKEAALLKQTKLDKYDNILLSFGFRFLRPTLYDLLAQRALDYFTNEEIYLINPAYHFTIRKPEAFAPAETFVKLKFETRDTGSLHYKALLIYQDLLKFHSADLRKDAFIDIDIKRIEFINHFGAMDEKDSLYQKALSQIRNKYPDDSTSAYAAYLLADHYFAKGWYTNWETGEPNDPAALITAKNICDEVLKKNPGSTAANECSRLLSLILEKSFSTQSENVSVPGQPVLFFFRYKNLDSVYFRLVKTNAEELKELQKYKSDSLWWQKRTELKPFREWTQFLPNPTDYQTHGVQLKMDPLPLGTYLLLISARENFDVTENILVSEIIHVSNISYIGKGADYFVMDRTTGKPIAGAVVQSWQTRRNDSTYADIVSKGLQFTTEQDGSFKLVEEYNKGTFSFEIRAGDDYLFLDDHLYNAYDFRDISTEKSPLSKRVFLFTDRSIYRPGQLVYFKGLALQYDPNTGKHQVYQGYQSKIILKDAGYQKVEEVSFTSNEFGTFHGTFRIPEGRLNGTFTLSDTLSYTMESIKVEEYKRPKFYVEIQKPAGAYRLNDSIIVKGMARAYAGNIINGAKVSYRVVRYKHMPGWRGGYRRPYPFNRNQVEVENGETVTNDAGEFFIPFKAIDDEYIPYGNPAFDFDIYVDVTDINGETRSGKTTVVVLSHAIQLNTEIPDRSPVDQFRRITITSLNANDVFEPLPVQIKISLLRSPTRVFRKRLWESPDQFVMTRDEFYQLFPFDQYSNEDDPEKWESLQTVLDDTFTTQKNGDYPIHPAISFRQGWYLVELKAKDKNGEILSEKKYIHLYEPNAGYFTYEAGLEIDTLQGSAEPGQKLRYRIQTAMDSIWVMQTVVSRREGENHAEMLNRGSRDYALDVLEEDRGGRTLSWMFIKNNRFYSGAVLFPVPWTNKELNISYETFRDLSAPGSEEKWKIRIQGTKGEKKLAEVLASMYDASLDQFTYHDWRRPDIYPESETAYTNWKSHESFTVENASSHNLYKKIEHNWNGNERQYDRFYFAKNDTAYESMWMISQWQWGLDDIGNPRLMRLPKPMLEEEPGKETVKKTAPTFQSAPMTRRKPEEEASYDEMPQTRKNLNETAFFFPDLHTDSTGAIEFSFILPEALTKWRFMAFAHTRDLAFGYSSREIITQKPLMVQPNAPRFLREGDKIAFSSKVVNLAENELSAVVELQLFDALTHQPVNNLFKNTTTTQSIKVTAGQSAAVKFPIEIPFQFNKVLTWRITARAKVPSPEGDLGEVSDGEENVLPVLTNRMPVTEAITVSMRNSGTKHFTFDKLLQSGNSKTLQHHALTIEYTSNPVWYAVQALPYVMEYPYECAEQTWNRVYSNAMAALVVGSSPRIRQVFEEWKTKDTASLMSNLQKNQELKSLLLEESPWIGEAKTEAEQKRNIALLFDLAKMSAGLDKSFKKLKEMQTPAGGFAWFKDGPDDRYITQYILTGIGHLKIMDARSGGWTAKKIVFDDLITKALVYLDDKIREDYEQLQKARTDLRRYTPGPFIIQYLYARSLFTEEAIPAASLPAVTFFRDRAQKTWLLQSKYMQGMIALAMNRTGYSQTASAILRSLKETATHDEELGMFWKDGNRSWWWYEAPIERQALMIEAFQEVGKDTNSVNELRTWLLKNKQTSNWGSTKATAEACYALLLQGTTWLNNEPTVEIKLGNDLLSLSSNRTEAGTGYFKKTIDGQSIKPEMGNVSIRLTPDQLTNPARTYPSGTGGQSTNQPTWGAVYWQYFEDLDKITTAATPLKLEKKLFIEKNTDRGPVLTPVNDGDVLKVGDKIKVRVELRVDRDMEYVHMKDMRASALEPVNVLSGYKWQGGLGYYETTRDASTNFFFDYLRKGSYVFEYPLFVTHTGNFSNGITTIQCMYAPEFSAHSEGVRITVK